MEKYNSMQRDFENSLTNTFVSAPKKSFFSSDSAAKNDPETLRHQRVLAAKQALLDADDRIKRIDKDKISILDQRMKAYNMMDALSPKSEQKSEFESNMKIIADCNERLAMLSQERKKLSQSLEELNSELQILLQKPQCLPKPK